MRLLRREPRRVHGLARHADTLLGRLPRLIERAQRRIRLLERVARRAELALDGEAPLERGTEPRLRLNDRLIARGELRLEGCAAPQELLALLEHAADPHRH
jgi:hypothetical protein